MTEYLSLLYPREKRPDCRMLPDQSAHDLSLDVLCREVGTSDAERAVIFHTMRQLSAEADVIRYRCEIFQDILEHPGLREKMQKLLDRVDFLRTYGSFGKDTDASGVWELVHRLDEMDEYIVCVQAIYECLKEEKVSSRGLTALREYARSLYEDQGFDALKKDIDALKKETSKVRSVTLGVNLNERFEPDGVGIVSINSKPFSKSGVLSNFCDFLNRGNEIQEGNDWNHNYVFRTTTNELAGIQDTVQNAALLAVTRGLAAMPGIAGVAADSRGGDVIRTLDRAIASMLTGIVKKLKSVLSRHVTVSTSVIAGLIPEFMYYIRWAEYIEKLQGIGFTFCRPEVAEEETGVNPRTMDARGLYNLKLAASVLKEGKGSSADIVVNDLVFDREHRIYLLTGANRGGKTTVTQAVGLLFVLAQGGIHVPAEKFVFSPADNIFTHYPADENQTMDLGRLGEESQRFRDLFHASTADSLLLLNESFSTTSFEEGYYIARDVVKAISRKGMRTIYNTHMHKLALELETLNGEGDPQNRIASLVAETEDGKRSYRIRVAPPGGLSYAKDIAEKYGVTFEQLMETPV